MKKITASILIICYCLLSGCSSQSPNKHISNELGIKLPKEVKIKYHDTHGGFHGDGTSYAKIELKDKVVDDVIAQIKDNKDWKELPLSENLQLIMFGGSKGSHMYLYNFAEEVGIPVIQQGYWLMIDRFDNPNLINDDTKLFKRGSFNFTISIFDTDSNILYYFEYDT